MKSRNLSVALLLAALALRPDGMSVRAQGPPSLPARFDAYIKAHVRLTAEAHARLLAGQPVTQLLDTDPATEVAIFGAVWVNAPVARYLGAVKDIESFEKGDNFLGTKRIAARPTFVAQEFAAMVDRMPEMTDYLPDLKKYLLGYPKVTLPNAESFLYWQSVRFGLKPTIRINHLTIVSQPSLVTVASKMLYASHYFWTAIELRLLAPDPARGEGFWFANVNRSRSDGLDGSVGALLRGKVRSEAEEGMQAALAITKKRMER